MVTMGFSAVNRCQRYIRKRFIKVYQGIGDGEWSLCAG